MRTRIELAEYFNQLGFKKGAEVGVCNGRYSLILCQKIPGLKLLGVDPYRPYGGHGIHRLQATQDDNLLTTREKLKDYPGFSLLVNTSEEAANWIDDGSLDFVFLDADHSYEGVRDDIKYWAPKVRSGGIISGHDYYQGKSGRMGVIKAVDEFITATGYELNLTDNLIEERPPGVDRDDRQPDWWVIKP